MKQTIIQENSFEKARKKIRDNKDKTIILTGNDDELNRKVLEKEKVDFFILVLKGRKDFQKQRNSGFNHVMAKIAKKQNVGIGINLDEITESEGKEKSEILARVRQNIKLCNKNKLKMKFFSTKQEKNIHDLKALGLVLGMPTWMTKEL